MDRLFPYYARGTNIFHELVAAFRNGLIVVVTFAPIMTLGAWLLRGALSG